MEAFRISVLCLFLCTVYVPYAVQGVVQATIHGEVGKTIKLNCPSGETETSKYRSWSKGKYDDTNKPPGEMLIYKAQGTDIAKGDLLRPDIKIDESTFTMTLIVQEDGRDNGHFTCTTEMAKNLYDTQEVLIFLQPNVTIATDKQPEEDVNVTVTCTVEKLHPNITEDQFTMRWGSRRADGTEFSGTPTEDGYMKYTLEKKKNLTQEDEGVKVECTVTPKANFGNPGMASLLLNFTMGPPPDTGGSTTGGSNVGAIVGGVIGGLAAVAIVVVIMVVILKKRKPKDTTKEPAAKGPRTKTNKPVSEVLQSEGLMYADLDLVNQPTRHKVEHEGSKPPVTPRPVQEPTEYAQIDFDKLKIKNQRDEEDLSLSDKE